MRDAPEHLLVCWGDAEQGKEEDSSSWCSFVARGVCGHPVCWISVVQCGLVATHRGFPGLGDSILVEVKMLLWSEADLHQANSREQARGVRIG